MQNLENLDIFEKNKKFPNGFFCFLGGFKWFCDALRPSQTRGDVYSGCRECFRQLGCLLVGLRQGAMAMSFDEAETPDI